MSGVWVSTMWESGDCHYSSGVWVVDHDGLILITVVPDDALNQNVEWSAQGDNVHGVANNVKLHICIV